MTHPASVSRSVSLFDVRPDLRPVRIGDPVVIAGNLDLCRTRVSYLPDGMSVGGCLHLSETPLTHLPDGLMVGKDLDLRVTPIQRLPQGLSVGRSLYLYGTPLTCLPDGLSIGGSLSLYGTSITHLPKDMALQGVIFPNTTLVDLVRLRATLTKPLVLMGSGHSAHATAAIFRRLEPYPDVLRVWRSIAADDFWVIRPS